MATHLVDILSTWRADMKTYALLVFAITFREHTAFEKKGLACYLLAIMLALRKISLHFLFARIRSAPRMRRTAKHEGTTHSKRELQYPHTR